MARQPAAEAVENGVFDDIDKDRQRSTVNDDSKQKNMLQLVGNIATWGSTPLAGSPTFEDAAVPPTTTPLAHYDCVPLARTSSTVQLHMDLAETDNDKDESHKDGGESNEVDETNHEEPKKEGSDK